MPGPPFSPPGWAVKVLHLSAGNLYGGIEAYLVTLARCRDLASGMEPHFGLCFPGRVRDELIAAGVPVHDLGAVRVSRPWTVLRARRRLKSILGDGTFAAAVTHGSWPHAVFAPVVRTTRARLASAVHGDLSDPTWLDRRAARTHPDVVLSNSRFTAGPAAKLFARSPVEVVYLPVPAPDIRDPVAARREIRAALGTPPEAVVILQASRLEAWKGHAVHVEALARLAHVPDWEAWFAGGAQKPGEAEFRADLMAQADRAGIAARVKFLGQRTDIPRLMAAADIYCQPNTMPEPFGLVFVEALYAGLPVVTSGAGGVTEIVSEGHGVLTRPGDHASVSAALLGLIRDPARRRALGAAGPTRAAELCDPARQLKRLATRVGAVST
ncbi:MAG: glycosyltransferase family 1 protein [Gemmataceae bacterium]|nr:glycosyltransferase family 1 protein [Gemmataceae bacterium]